MLHASLSPPLFLEPHRHYGLRREEMNTPPLHEPYTYSLRPASLPHLLIYASHAELTFISFLFHHKIDLRLCGSDYDVMLRWALTGSINSRFSCGERPRDSATRILLATFCFTHYASRGGDAASASRHWPQYLASARAFTLADCFHMPSFDYYIDADA